MSVSDICFHVILGTLLDNPMPCRQSSGGARCCKAGLTDALILHADKSNFGQIHKEVWQDESVAQLSSQYWRLSDDLRHFLHFFPCCYVGDCISHGLY